MRTPPTRPLSTSRAWPGPPGDHTTRQWLARVDCDFPPSVLKRTNEFSPMRISWCGLICNSITILLVSDSWKAPLVFGEPFGPLGGQELLEVRVLPQDGDDLGPLLFGELVPR